MWNIWIGICWDNNNHGKRVMVNAVAIQRRNIKLLLVGLEHGTGSAVMVSITGLISK